MKVSDEILNLVPYQPGKPIEETQREYNLDTVTKLASNENPLGPSEKVKAAIVKAAEEIHRYPDASAYRLSQACKKHFSIDENKMVFGNGSNELIDLLIRLYCIPGDKVLTSQAAFIAYKICAQAARVKTHEIRLKQDFTIDLKAMDQYIESHWDEKHKLVFIPNPNNPTGTYVNRSETEAFLEKYGNREDMLLVFDEAYSEYVTAEDHPNALDYLKYSNVVVLRTLSKAYGLASLRLGILFAAPEIVDLIHRIRMPFNVSHLAQEAAIAALEDQDYVKRSQEVNAEGMKYLTQELTALGYDCIPSQGNFILFDSGQDASVFVESLLKRGVILRPLKGYGFQQHVRISIGLPEENAAAIQALKELQNSEKV